MASSSWATAAGDAKRVYDNAVKNAQPACSIIKKRAPIDQTIKRISEGFQVGVLVVPPNGVTYVGSSPTKTTLLTGRPMVITQAQALSYETDIHEEIPWATFTRLDGDQAAIDDYFLLLETAMMRVGNTREEISLLAGQTSLGTVDSVGGSAAAGTITFTAATWRGGLFWALGPGATMDAFTSTTKNNATAAIVLVGVSQSTAYTINITCGGTIGSEIAAGDTIWLEGTWDGTTFYDMPGLVAQAANTTGTSMGVSATTYPNWAGNTASVGGPMTSDVLETYLGVLRNRDQEGKLTAYMPETVWRQIFEEVQGMRYLDSSYLSGNQKIGNEDITYVTSRFKNVELVVHPLLRDTEMLIQRDDAVVRVGSRDVEFGVPVRMSANPAAVAQGVLMITGTNAAEAFVTKDTGVINRMPGCAYSLTGISV